MADISKADLKKEIAAILEGADLTTTTAKKVRQQVEEKLDINLSSRKKEIDEIVMQCLEDKQNEGKKGKSKKNGKSEDDEDEEDDAGSDAEEDEEEDDDASEEEEKPKKRAAAPKKPAAKRKKADSDDDNSDPGSEDEDEKDDDYSPAKKKAAPKKKKTKAAAAKKGRGKKKGGSDSDSDEDWGKKKKKAAGGKKKTGFGKDCSLSPELAAIVGSDCMPRHEVVKRIWAYIKEKNLYDPTNKQFCVCDAELHKVFGVKKFRTFGMMKFLKTHFLD
ncbi:hypothetical protein M8J76_009706 [Diaphorina citri]|nr:hypothetical protein M8J75_003686 [Diaphorina citri]KAI5714025.1 hypothetical protein M8J76_009706 [Diaphorina citri]